MTVTAEVAEGGRTLAETYHAHDQFEPRYGVVSKAGGRDYNEDACAVRDYSVRRRPKYRCMMAVGDGMGGHNAGDVASHLAVQMFEQLAGPRQFADTQEFSENVERVMWNAFSAINSHIHDLGESSLDRKGMGTTLTCALVDDSLAHIAHVGDTRAYIISSDGIAQVTEDHSIVGKMIADGILTEREAQSHDQRNVLTRAIGPEPNVEIDILKAAVKPGETVLICTDGLHSMVSTPEIFQIVRAEGNLQSACEHLADLAIARGGEDNVSAIAWMMPLAESLVRRDTSSRQKSSKGTGKGLAWWGVMLITSVALGLGFFVGWGIGAVTHLGSNSGGHAKQSTPTGTQSGTTQTTPSNRFPKGTYVQVSLKDPNGVYVLRKAPSTDSDVVTSLTDGYKLKVISSAEGAKSSATDWYQVKVVQVGPWYGATGYAKGENLKKTKQEQSNTQ